MKVLQFAYKDVSLNDLKPWKSLLILTISSEDSSPIHSLAPSICCLSFLPISFHEVNYPGRLKDHCS